MRGRGAQTPHKPVLFVGCLFFFFFFYVRLRCTKRREKERETAAASVVLSLLFSGFIEYTLEQNFIMTSPVFVINSGCLGIELFFGFFRLLTPHDFPNATDELRTNFTSTTSIRSLFVLKQKLFYILSIVRTSH